MKLRTIILLLSAVVTLSAFAPAKDKFSAAEQQQISIATPNLFAQSDAFSIEMSLLGSKEYSFPLPVGKAEKRGDNRLAIVSSEGDAVKAMFDGVVRLSRNHPDYGNVIVIRHYNGLETVYGNNAQNLVSVGDVVTAGQTIAIVGSKDGKTYLDFSIMINGARINPETVIGLKSHRLHKQTLLCTKKGALVDVQTLKKGDVDVADNTGVDLNADPFAKSDVYKLDLVNIEKERWAYPLPGAKVISPYGGRRRHAGVDLKTKPNDEIVAAFDGVVTRSSSYYGYASASWSSTHGVWRRSIAISRKTSSRWATRSRPARSSVSQAARVVPRRSISISRPLSRAAVSTPTSSSTMPTASFSRPPSR